MGKLRQSAGGPDAKTTSGVFSFGKLAKSLRAKEDGPATLLNLAAFGKHPGWDDHIEDLGLESQTLVDVKRLLYVQGIGGNIDAGAWDKLDEAQRVEGFGHVFAWWTPQDVVVGRFWSSRDGKGRTRYPMVVCAQCRGLPFSWITARVLPRLEKIEAGCKGASDAATVRSIMDTAREELRRQVPPALEATEPIDALDATAQIARSQVMQQAQDGLSRILYLLDRELANWSTRADSSGGRTFHMRVPACEEQPDRALHLWSGFVQAVLPGPASFIVLYPLGVSWVDVIVGEPDTADFFCVRAKPAKLPLTTEIPYSLSPQFVAKSQELATALRDYTPVAAGGPVRPTVSGDQGAKRPKEGSSGAGDSSKWGMIVAAVVVLVVLVVLVGIVGYLALSGGGAPKPTPTPDNLPQQEVFDPSAWKEWCGEYSSWFGKFVSDLSDRPHVEFDQDPHLQAILARLGEALKNEVVLDPRQAARSPGVPLQDLAAQPPSAAKKAQAIQKTRQALDLIADVRKQLTSWPLLTEIQTIASDFQARGWTGYGQGLANLAQQATPQPQNQIVAAVEKILVIAPQAMEVEKLWGQLSTANGHLAESSDPVLGSFPGYASRMLKLAVPGGESTDFAPLRDELARLLELCKKLDHALQDDWPRAEQDVFRAQSSLYKSLEETPSPATFNRWLEELKEYLPPQGVEDPRVEQALADRIGEIAAGYDRLQGAQPNDPQLPALNEKIQRARADLEQVMANPWITKNLYAITNAAGAMDSRLELLKQELSAVAAARATSDNEYREGIAGRSTVSKSRSKVIDAEWLRRRDEILNSQLSGPALRQKIEELERFLVALDQSVPAAPVTDLSQTPWGDALSREWFATQREEGLRKLLADVRWVEGTAVVGSTFESAKAELVDLCQRSDETIQALNQDLIALQRGLEEFHPWAQPAAPGLPSMASLWAKWEESPLLKVPGVQRAVGPMVTQLARIKLIEQSTDPGGLVALANGQGDPGAAARVAAWRRVGKVVWPGSPGDALVQELAMRQSLGDLLGSLSSKAAQETLKNELATEGHRRWQAHFNQFSQAKDIEDALKLMDQFAVDPKKLDATARFNWMLFHLKRADPKLDEAQLTRLIRDAVQQTGALVPELAQKQVAGGFAEKLTELTMTQPNPTAAVEPTKLGPLSSPLAEVIPWQLKEEDDGGKLIYSWKKENQAIEFVRVEGTTGLVSHDFYLATTEVSLDLFVKVIDEAKAWPQFGQLLRDFDDKALTPPPPKGPCVWTWKVKQDERTIKKASRWLFWARGDDAYPEELKKEAKPSNDHPMQEVSAQAALYFAHMLGCRLPSASEWLVAYQINKKDTAGMNWNLRDETWLVQRDYVKWLADKQNKLMDWPDAAIFWPSKDFSQNVGKNAQYYRAWQDSYLWFSTVDVGPGKPFKHLIGNVAEFVFDEPQAFEQLKSPTPQAVKQFLEQNGAQLKVVGGSALSAPELKYDEPYPTELTDSLQGYSDVGFRLAFSVPSQTLASKFRRLVADQPYLAPSSK